MKPTPLLNDPEQAWAPFEPSNADPWDLARVAHLHRRAGFSAPWNVLQRDIEAGPRRAVDQLLEGEPNSGDGTPALDFDRLMNTMATRLGSSGDLNRLQGTWLYRMIFTPQPLRERLTLFWHDHFATSFEKVGDISLMRRQNELFRKHALGSFGALLQEIGQDPAMLVWLDATANRKARPNENYAREVMELFTIGRGAYSEQDIQEAARAFTGSFVVNGQFRVIDREHDDEPKTIFGRTGHFSGNDVAGILLEQPACAEFLCRKLFAHFVSEVDEPSEALIAPLAIAYRESGYETRRPVELILRSRLFQDPSMRRRRVKSPVEFAIGTIRALEVLRPTVSAVELASACSQMGQSLFAPPSVAGWDGGAAWINTTTSLARSNFALALIEDRKRFDPQKRAEQHGASDDPASFYVNLLVQDGLNREVRRRLRGQAREVASLLLTSPEYQLA